MEAGRPAKERRIEPGAVGIGLAEADTADPGEGIGRPEGLRRQAAVEDSQAAHSPAGVGRLVLRRLAAVEGTHAVGVGIPAAEEGIQAAVEDNPELPVGLEAKDTLVLPGEGTLAVAEDSLVHHKSAAGEDNQVESAVEDIQAVDQAVEAGNQAAGAAEEDIQVAVAVGSQDTQGLGPAADYTQVAEEGMLMGHQGQTEADHTLAVEEGTPLELQGLVLQPVPGHTVSAEEGRHLEHLELHQPLGRHQEHHRTVPVDQVLEVDQEKEYALVQLRPLGWWCWPWSLLQPSEEA